MKLSHIKMSQCFPEPFRSSGWNINATVDVSSCARKEDIKNTWQADTSSFALKTNLASLKTEVDKLNVDKSAPVLANLSKLSDVVKNDAAKKLFVTN